MSAKVRPFRMRAFSGGKRWSREEMAAELRRRVRS
jgi:hypothetical protein